MAIPLSAKTNVTAPGGAYPYGNIKNDTGVGDGTPVDVQVYGDFHQYFARLLDMAGITANGNPDNGTNGYQYYEALAKLAAVGFAMNTGGEWVIESTISVSALGTFTVGVGDLAYFRWKIVGKTLFMQIQIRNATIGSAPTSLLIDLPASLSGLGTGVHYSNSTGVQVGGVYNFSEVLFVAINGGTGAEQLRLNRAANAAFTNGTNNQNIDVNIVAELTF